MLCSSLLGSGVFFSATVSMGCSLDKLFSESLVRNCWVCCVAIVMLGGTLFVSVAFDGVDDDFGWEKRFGVVSCWSAN